MHRVIYEIGILLQLFVALTKTQCPEHFRYYRNETTGKIMGMIELPVPPEKLIPLHLRVSMSLATVLPTKYVGHIEMAKSKKDIIQSLMNESSILYKIYFPLDDPIPVINDIVFNEVHYCNGPPIMGFTVTKIKLEHSLYPPRVILPLTKDVLQYFSNKTTLKLPITKINNDTIKTLTTKKSFYQLLHPSKQKLSNFDCGVNNEIDVNLGEVKSTTWPWLVAIFDYKYEFLCNGMIITNRHVLTVAHCLKDVDSNLLIVSLGRRSLTDSNEEDGLEKPIDVEVDVVKLHPDYGKSWGADYDLAIVKLTETIDYTPNVRPICLWMGKKDVDSLIGGISYVIGWGSNESNDLNLYKTSKVEVVPQKDCHEKEEFNRVITNQTLCAKSKDVNGFCKENSGSGLIVYHKRFQRYHLRGLVSLSMQNVNTGSCKINEYVVYVDVAKHISWIKKQIV